MNSQRLMIIPVLFSLVMMSVGPAFAAEIESTTSTLNVPASCGITLGGPMDFGSPAINTQSDEKELAITGTGSGISQVSVFATDWLDGSTNIVDGENTRFGESTGSFASKTPLNSTSSFVVMGNVASGATNSTQWQVELNLNESTFQGSISQVLTIVVIGCL